MATEAERSLSLSIDEVDLLLHLLSDEVGREWRHDRHAREDVERLQQRLLALRSEWADATSRQTEPGIRTPQLQSWPPSAP